MHGPIWRWVPHYGKTVFINHPLPSRTGLHAADKMNQHSTTAYVHQLLHGYVSSMATELGGKKAPKIQGGSF